VALKETIFFLPVILPRYREIRKSLLTVIVAELLFVLMKDGVLAA
jgi:hypothetical protein